jgi:hypothetical protein
MPTCFPDHGLPLVQLKEKRRTLVIAHQRRNSPLSSDELLEIAAVQQAIFAFEEIMSDLEAELEPELPAVSRLSVVA